MASVQGSYYNFGLEDNVTHSEKCNMFTTHNMHPLGIYRFQIIQSAYI